MSASYPKIFINYRRKDARGLVEKLYQDLSLIYGEDEVFFDQSDISKGASITETIKQNLAHCDLFLPVIGPNWDRRSYLKRLKDPMDWVRQEMELAISLNKHILPVLIDRDTMPDNQEIPASIHWEKIFDRNAIKLKEDTNYWDEELKRYGEDIKKYTGLKQKKVTDAFSEQEIYMEQICYLNRETEYGDVKYPEKEGQFMFAISGSVDSGFKAFTKRCSLEILEGTEIKIIRWKQFASMRNSRARKCELLEQIAKQIGENVKGLNEEDIIKKFQTHFRNKKYIFRCTRFNGSSNNHNKGVMQEWWTIWQTLIATEPNRNVVVLLFTVPSWILRLNLFSRFPANTQPQNLGSFHGIKKNDVTEWKENYLDPLNFTLPDQEISRLFFMCWSKNFQAVESRLLQAMKKVQAGKKPS